MRTPRLIVRAAQRVLVSQSEHAESFARLVRHALQAICDVNADALTIEIILYLAWVTILC